MRNYPWPASALEPADMRLLHAARKRVQPRIPITELLAQAVRRAYGQADVSAVSLQTSPPLMEAA